MEFIVSAFSALITALVGLTVVCWKQNTTINEYKQAAGMEIVTHKQIKDDHDNLKAQVGELHEEFHALDARINQQALSVNTLEGAVKQTADALSCMNKNMEALQTTINQVALNVAKLSAREKGA